MRHEPARVILPARDFFTPDSGADHRLLRLLLRIIFAVKGSHSGSTAASNQPGDVATCPAGKSTITPPSARCVMASLRISMFMRSESGSCGKATGSM
ncbi:MAG: hypothetical protein CVT80_10115 [Alphaproteobacteria bacterium HGW-Alphaproteobacteria-2]|nr:MAG: hypothetical protein CVT80_10115 [Alphaproteobacteria bacterium HGW-Alphaproteobacteria-2]